MRGKGTQIKTIATNMRITPAYAGKRVLPLFIKESI